ncbi:MAG TPA: DUF503 domain-containing protein [Fimbriimonas sp.]
MIVGHLQLTLRLDGCFSLKDKRRVLKSLMDRVRRCYQVSIAETDDCDLWNSAVVGVAYVSNDAGHVESVLTKVATAFDLCPEVSVEGAERAIERR